MKTTVTTAISTYVAMNFCSEYSHSNLNENSLIKSRDSYDSYIYRL